MEQFIEFAQWSHFGLGGLARLNMVLSLIMEIQSFDMNFWD